MSTSEVQQNEVTDYLPDDLPRLGYVVLKDPPLDSTIANMDEEFNSGFEKRMSRVIDLPDLQFVQAGDDMHKTLRIFRRVAQLMGGEWKPVFMELVKKQNPDVVERELRQIETHKPLIQGYRALMVWKEMSGSLFHMTKLIDALKANNMEDIAHETLFMTKDVGDNAKPIASLTRSSTRRRRIDVSAIENDPLNNKVLLLVAKKLSGEWNKLGQALGIEEAELEDIKDYVGAEHEKLFKVLWSWKEMNKNSADCKENFKKALSQIGRQDVFDECCGGEGC